MTVPIFEPIYKVLILIAVALGIAVGWLAHSPVKAVHEAAAPAQRQADGSLVLARAEGTTTPPAAPHALPKGAKEERRVQVVVQPQRGAVVRATPEHPSAIPDVPAGRVTTGDSLALDHFSQPVKMVDDSCDCPPVTVDLSLVRMPDKTRRVVASSPDGVVLSGVDIPVEPLPEVRMPRWTLSALAVADLEGTRPGAMLQRCLGPVVLGAGAFVFPVNLKPAGIVSAGITW